MLLHLLLLNVVGVLTEIVVKPPLGQIDDLDGRLSDISSQGKLAFSLLKSSAYSAAIPYRTTIGGYIRVTNF